MRAEGDMILSFSCHFERCHNRTDEVWADGTNAGFFVDGGAGISFFAGIAVDAKEGDVYSIGEHLLVDGAKEVTLYIDIETSFREVNFRETCMKRLEKAQKKGWEQCLAEHIRCLLYTSFQRWTQTGNVYDGAGQPGKFFRCS